MLNNKVILLSAAIIIFAGFGLFSCNKTTMQTGFWGQDVTRYATILRDKNTKQASLEVNEKTNWQLYAGLSVDQIDREQPVLKGSDIGIFAIDIPVDKHYYFQLVTDEGAALLAERQLPMTGGYNFRDLGGFRTADGRYTQWGKIFRSDDLHNLTDADLAYLSSIPLTSIVDFRSEEEIGKAPDKNPSSVKTNHQLKIDPGNVMAFSELTQKSEQEMEQQMMELNELLVADSSCVAQYKKFFVLLQNKTEAPLMYHCSAGKDRTGMATVLILSALGVDHETIVQDYLASNYYLGDKYDRLKAEQPKLTPLFEVRRHYIEAGLAKIEEQYGSIDAYLTEVLNVDIDLMRNLYLY